MIPIVVHVRVNETEASYSMRVEEGRFVFPATLATPIDINRNIPTYEGEYTVTPSSETQYLRTNELMMRGDITINPVPSNYGLITWDGTNLTVS